MINGENAEGNMEKIKTLLQKAVIDMQIEVVSNLINQGVQKSDVKTSLEFAFETKNVPIIKLLIEAGGDVFESNFIHNSIDLQNDENLTLYLKVIGGVNKRDKCGYTPLRHAVRLGNAYLVKFLLSSGANVFTQPYEEPYLHEAIKKKGASIVEMLLDARVDVNAENEDKNTPLHVASEYFCYDVFKLILNAGADVNAVNKDQNTPLNLAIICQQLNVVKLLLDAGTNVKVQSYVRAWNVSTKKNPLHLAAQLGNINIIQLLVNAGVGVNSKDENDYTPLHIAIQHYHDDVSKLLLQVGADPNVIDDERNTPLHMAVEYKNEIVVKLLLDAGADLTTKNANRNTPLHFAIQHYQDDIFECLLKAGADPNAANKDGDTPLHLAFYLQKANVIKLLLDAGANVNAENLSKNTPLHFAIQFYNDEIFKLLLKAGGNLNVQNSAGETLFHTACYYQKLNAIKLLLKSGMSFKLYNRFHYTPFMFFAQKFINTQGGRNYFKFFLEHNDVNLVNEKGKNTLTDMLESIIYTKKRKYFYKLILEHIAKIKILNYQLDQSLLDAISRKNDYDTYFKKCTQELEEAKSIQLHNCWVTYLNLLADHQFKFVKYAGNEDLIEDSKNCVEKFPIYGATMKKNVSQGIIDRKSFDSATDILSYCLPIFNPTHLIIMNVLFALSAEDWKKLSEKKSFGI